MAGSYRQIHTKIWTDDWFLDLEPDYKLLFVYLFSNARANLAGLYDLSLKVASFESGLERGDIEAGLAVFQRAGKAFYEDGWIWIPNLLRYNAQNLSSAKIQKHLRDTIGQVPDIPLKQRWIAHYNGIVAPRYRMDTVSIPDLHEHEHEHEHEQEHDQEQEQEQMSGADAPSPGGDHPDPPNEEQGGGPEAASSLPSTFQEWSDMLQGSKNRPADLVRMFEALYPGRDPPAFGHIGKTARDIGGAGRLAELLWQNSTRPPTGDVLAYCLAIHKNGKGSNKDGQHVKLTDDHYATSGN